MYGQCKICAALFGTKDGKNFYTPCKHIREKNILMENTSQQITCKCGQTTTWITAGKKIKEPCPNCNRLYIGKYNPKTYSIDAVEIKK